MFKKATKIKEKNVTKPTAWICSIGDNGRKSIKNGKVYLKDKEQFQIELHNPTNDILLANIIINNESICKNGVHIEPNSRVYVDYHIDNDSGEFIYHHKVDINGLNNEISDFKTDIVQVFFYTEIGTLLEMMKKLKDDRKPKIDLSDFFKNRTTATVPNPVPHAWGGVISNPIWINTDIYNGLNGKGNINSGSTNTFNNIKAINLTNTSGNAYTSTNLSNLITDNSFTTSDLSNVIKGEIEINDNTSDISESIPNEKEMEYEDDAVSIITFELYPDLLKPTSTKEINEHKKSRDNISKIIDLKNLLENDYITREEFDKLKAEII